jgi:hypothetical protein
MTGFRLQTSENLLSKIFVDYLVFFLFFPAPSGAGMLESRNVPYEGSSRMVHVTI